MDGISRRHDRVFLQEVLIPAKLKILARDGNSSLRRISAYDDWWRLIRNAGITSLQDLHGYDGAVPGCIKRMIKWQQKIPSAILGAGPFSKFFMMSSYINNILTGCI
jgi:hypothetical protein